MNNTMLKILSLVLLVSLAGCGTPSSPLKNYNGANHGHLMLSLSQMNNESFARALFVRQAGTSNMVEIMHDAPARKKADFESESEHGIVAAVKLPPGEYEIVQFQYGTWRDFGGISHPLSMPPRFTIQPGAITYAGNFLISMMIREGAPIKDDGGIVTVYAGGLQMNVRSSDSQARDLAVALERHPELAGKNIRNVSGPAQSMLLEYKQL